MLDGFTRDERLQNSADTRTRGITTICSLDLVPMGEARLPFAPYSFSLDAEVIADGSLQIAYFGPN